MGSKELLELLEEADKLASTESAWRDVWLPRFKEAALATRPQEPTSSNRSASQPQYIGPNTVQGYDGLVRELHTTTGQASQPPEARWHDTATRHWKDAPTQPDVTAWLIERGGLCLGFCENLFAWLAFTDENALRFSRDRDAYGFMETVKWKPFHLPLEGARVTEHMWSAATPTQPYKHPTLNAMHAIDPESAKAYAECGPEELRAVEPPLDWKAEGYVCAALHRVPISHCKDCDEAARVGEPPQEREWFNWTISQLVERAYIEHSYGGWFCKWCRSANTHDDRCPLKPFWEFPVALSEEGHES